MKKIHFAAANGFPALTYEYLFSKLSIGDINYINIIGHKPSKLKADLAFLKNEIIESIEADYTQPVIGIGHSSGGAGIMMAAAERPELFEKIILIDPPLFNKRKRFILGIGRAIGLWNRIGPAKKARNRRSQFSNKAEAFGYWKEKPLFKNFHPNCFESYVEHGLKEYKDKFELAFSAAIEEAIFFNLVVNFPKNMEKLNATLIHAKHSDIFWQSDIDWWKKKHPNFKLVEFDGAHLFPLEQPDRTAELLNEISLS
ncbi:MAG: alpha/beta fold hydrolase [Kangiellaceae bacterium]